MTAFTLEEAAELFGLPQKRIAGLAATGCVAPELPTGTAALSPRDLVALNGVRAIEGYGVSAERMAAAAASLRDGLGAATPLGPARVGAVGSMRPERPLGPLWEAGLDGGVPDWSALDPGYRDVARLDTVRLPPPVFDANDWFELAVDEHEGDHAQALSCYRKALELEPAHVEALLNAGAIHQVLGDFDTARAHYAQALDASPNHLLARFNLATLLGAEGQDAEALAAYGELVEALSDARYNRALAFLDAGRRDEALDEFRLLLGTPQVGA